MLLRFFGGLSLVHQPCSSNVSSRALFESEVNFCDGDMNWLYYKCVQILNGEVGDLSMMVLFWCCWCSWGETWFQSRQVPGFRCRACGSGTGRDARQGLRRTHAKGPGQESSGGWVLQLNSYTCHSNAQVHELNGRWGIERWLHYTRHSNTRMSHDASHAAAVSMHPHPSRLPLAVKTVTELIGIKNHNFSIHLNNISILSQRLTHI